MVSRHAVFAINEMEWETVDDALAAYHESDICLESLRCLKEPLSTSQEEFIHSVIEDLFDNDSDVIEIYKLGNADPVTGLMRWWRMSHAVIPPLWIAHVRVGKEEFFACGSKAIIALRCAFTQWRDRAQTLIERGNFDPEFVILQ